MLAVGEEARGKSREDERNEDRREGRKRKEKEEKGRKDNVEAWSHEECVTRREMMRKDEQHTEYGTLTMAK